VPLETPATFDMTGIPASSWKCGSDPGLLTFDATFPDGRTARQLLITRAEAFMIRDPGIGQAIQQDQTADVVEP